MSKRIQQSDIYWEIRNQDAVRHGSHANRLRWLDRKLPLEQPVETVLDAGCGEALFTAALARRAAHIRAFDPSAKQIAANCETHPGISFFVQNPAKPIAAESKTMDTVWCADLLSRIINPAFALKEFHRILKPNGQLLVTVPYHGFGKNLCIALFNWNEHFAPDSQQTRFFTEKTLTRLAKRSGFRDITVETCRSTRPSRDFFAPSDLLLSAKK
jgi:ubiquinone/menaquinone biosynthesis C-methylase UbiE